MDAAAEGRTHITLRHTLAGLEAGIAGALFMIIWLVVCSLWNRRSIWTIPNLYATTFYGPRAYENQFLHSSWSGLALMLIICGLGGIIWGMVCGSLIATQRQPAMTILRISGLIAGLLLWFLTFDVIWSRANPLIPLYAPELQAQTGFILWGISLARSPLYAQRIAAALRSGEVLHVQDAAGIRSGA